VTTTVQVSGTTLDQLSLRMDPQNWDVCMHDYFDATDVVKLPPVFDSNHDATKDPIGPTPGSSWKNRPLFERFNIIWWNFAIPVPSSIFRNILAIDSIRDGSGYLVNYCLATPQWSVVPVLDPISGLPVPHGFADGIDVDEGHLQTPASASSLEVVKYIRFMDSNWPPIYRGWINSMAYALLKYSGGEVLKLACCDTTALPPPGPPILVP
jgi:hypothetical protein